VNSTEARLALNLIPGVGPVRLRKLLRTFETPERVLLANTSELRAVEGIGPDTASAIASWQDTVKLDDELKRVADFGARLIDEESPEYPASLREIHDPPMVLYVWGELQERDRHGVGVVGSRKATHYGMEAAKKLSFQLAYAGMTVVSGLARGIDTAAHQGALAAKGRTIAVLGSGLNQLYPRENMALAELIAQNGAVVSEFPMEMKASTQTFPMRNRIVSGWSRAVLVVEAALNSGALITANQALDQGRSIYSVPGPIDRPSSAGTNRLIQQGAKLVMSASDILDDLDMLFDEVPEAVPENPRLAELPENERLIYDALGDEETPIDALISRTQLPGGIVSASLLSLEIKRLVKQLPGRHFVKLR